MTALVAAPQEVAEGPETHDKSEHADHDCCLVDGHSLLPLHMVLVHSNQFQAVVPKKAAAMFDKFRPGTARRLWPTLLLIAVIGALGVAMALVMSE